jgi:sulfite reductase (NADPH) flavoprotein alpha-component
MTPATTQRVVRLAYDKDHPFRAPLVESVNLTGPGSGKDTRHLVFDIAGSGLAYKPGDSLGIWPANCDETAEQTLATLGASGDEPVPAVSDATRTVPLRDALRKERTITLASVRLVELLAAVATDPDDAAALRGLLETGVPEGLQVLDLLTEFRSARPNPATFAAALGQLRPRLYSIASAPAAHGDLVHLTIAVVRYTNLKGRACHGVASTYAVERLGVGQTAPVYVHSAPKFSLPADPSADLIMIGPGTGIAPLRSFLFERRLTGATGRNWLYFGDRHRATDFLYEDDLLGFLGDGTLTRFDLAFSRDQPQKVYVQHRMRENAAELWRWIDAGAHVRVCGDAGMGKDVDAALKDIVRAEGRVDADAFVKQMTRDGRYQRDVY